jgi:hypothetical protein
MNQSDGYKAEKPSAWTSTDTLNILPEVQTRPFHFITFNLEPPKQKLVETPTRRLGGFRSTTRIQFSPFAPKDGRDTAQTVQKASIGESDDLDDSLS